MLFKFVPIDLSSAIHKPEVGYVQAASCKLFLYNPDADKISQRSSCFSEENYLLKVSIQIGVPAHLVQKEIVPIFGMVTFVDVNKETSVKIAILVGVNFFLFMEKVHSIKQILKFFFKIQFRPKSNRWA